MAPAAVQTLSGIRSDSFNPNKLPYNDYFEYSGSGLNFKIHIAPKNMSNHNTSEYMDRIR